MNTLVLALQQPLPKYKHWPGNNARPAEDFLPDLLFDFTTPVTSNNWSDNLAWCFGVRLVNEAFFWEAHEALEPVWMKTLPNTREQHLVQGVIQLANCGLKSAMQKPKAAAKLAVLANECVNRAYNGMDTGLLMGLEQLTLTNAIASAAHGSSLPELVLKTDNVTCPVPTKPKQL